MDYQFVKDIEGGVRVQMSMDHEVIGQWFNEEVTADPTLLDTVMTVATRIKGTEQQWQHVGREYTIGLSDDEIMIQANLLAISVDELDEGMSYYDQESLSFCGFEDFFALVDAYRQFRGQ
ncbi:YacL family protein [Rosenbergiella epipactidis]|uniref:YacL family protein n=1 Tax=Rosenbergiella epipactidis TaxID=1544694 RepID=UPI001F4E4B81|nr:YacL family protein [Rosenbergiella epipactidis]